MHLFSEHKISLLCINALQEMFCVLAITLHFRIQGSITVVCGLDCRTSHTKVAGCGLAAKVLRHTQIGEPHHNQTTCPDLVKVARTVPTSYRRECGMTVGVKTGTMELSNPQSLANVGKYK